MTKSYTHPLVAQARAAGCPARYGVTEGGRYVLQVARVISGRWQIASLAPDAAVLERWLAAPAASEAHARDVALVSAGAASCLEA